MKIYSLTMHNFMLFPKFHRIFGDKDVIGIIAEYKADRTRSNRGGKTVILEAMRYALNGSSRAPRTVDLIHQGEKEMSVELVLIENGAKHTVRRGCDIKGNSWIDADNFTKADEAQRHIDSLLGFNAADFDLTAFFKQQDINQFMEMKPREKQKHLMQWMDNKHWLRLERDVLDELGELNKRLVALNSRRDVLKEQVDGIGDWRTERAEVEAALLAEIVKRENLDIQLTKLRKSVLSAHDRKNLRVRLRDLREVVTGLQAIIAKQERAAVQMVLARKQLDALPKRVVNLPVDDSAWEKASIRLQQVSAAKVALVDQLSTAAKNMTGVCPILQKACDRIEFSEALVAGMQAKIKTAGEVVAKRRARVEAIAAARRAETARQALAARIEALAPLGDSVTGSKAELARAVTEKKKVKKQILKGQSNVTLEEIEALRQDVQQTDENIAEFNSKIGALREQRERAADLKKQLDKVHVQVRKVGERIAVRKYVAYMFGRNGIPAQEIENGFEEIEDETNYVLHRFGTGMSIMFNPDRELKQWEPACLACETAFAKGAKTKLCLVCGTERQHKRKDELTVRVLEGGEDHDFGMESGGGKTIVSFSNRLALTRLKQRKSGTNFNVLFLDEPDSALDRPNKKAFMDLITTTLIKKFGFEQIFWVSHDKTICESIPNVLRVVRFEKHSVAGWL